MAILCGGAFNTLPMCVYIRNQFMAWNKILHLVRSLLFAALSIFRLLLTIKSRYTIVSRQLYSSNVKIASQHIWIYRFQIKQSFSIAVVVDDDVLAHKNQTKIINEISSMRAKWETEGWVSRRQLPFVSLFMRNWLALLLLLLWLFSDFIWYFRNKCVHWIWNYKGKKHTHKNSKQKVKNCFLFENMRVQNKLITTP